MTEVTFWGAIFLCILDFHIMAKQWMSLAHASSMLGISVKTLHVRIEEQGYQTHIKSGKRYVAIDVPDKQLASPSNSPMLAKLADTRTSKAIKHLSQQHAREVRTAQHAVTGWQQAAAQAQQVNEERKRELRATRLRSTASASAAGLALCALVLGGFWATRSLTTADGMVQLKENQLSSTKAQTQTLEDSLGDARESLAMTRYRLNSVENEFKTLQQQTQAASIEAAAAKREAQVLREQLDKQRQMMLAPASESTPNMP